MVDHELRFVIVPAYLLSMPPPPDVGPMRVSSYHNLIKLLTTVLTEHDNKMVPNFLNMCFSKKAFDSDLIYNSTLFGSFLA